MQFSKSIPLSIFILLLFATFMAIAGVRAIFRLSPEIDRINKSNTESLYLIDKMLSAEVTGNIMAFEENLAQEKENITEPMEAERIAQIEQVYKKAFNGDVQARKILLTNLTDLSEINRLAMIDYAQNAKKLSQIIGYKDTDKAYLAALLHDCAKCIDKDKMNEIEEKIELYQVFYIIALSNISVIILNVMRCLVWTKI